MPNGNDSPGSKLYQTLHGVWQQAMDDKRKAVASGDYTPERMDAHLATLLGAAGMPEMSFDQLNRSMAQVGSGPGGPRSPLDASRDRATSVFTGMGLGIPKLLSQGTREAVGRERAQEPVLGRALEVGGGLLPTMVGGGAPTLLGRLGSMAGMGAVQAGSEVPPAEWAAHPGRGATVAGLGAAAGAAGQAAGEFIPAALGVAGKMVGRGGAEGAATTQLQRTARLSGGPDAVAAAGQAQDAATPLLQTRLHETTPELGEAHAAAARQNPTARRDVLLPDAEKAMEEATAAKAVVGLKYDKVLARYVDDKRVRDVFKRPVIQKFLDHLEEAGLIQGAQRTGRPTARLVNDLRMALEYKGPVEDLVGLNKVVTQHQRELLNDAGRELRAVLSEKVPGFDALQAEYGPYAEAWLRRRSTLNRLNRSSSWSPPEEGTTLLQKAKEAVGGKTVVEAKHGRAGEQVKMLTRPYKDVLGLLSPGRKGLLGNVLGQSAQAVDPFFQQTVAPEQE